MDTTYNTPKDTVKFIQREAEKTVESGHKTDHATFLQDFSQQTLAGRKEKVREGEFDYSLFLSSVKSTFACPFFFFILLFLSTNPTSFLFPWSSHSYIHWTFFHSRVSEWVSETSRIPLVTVMKASHKRQTTWMRVCLSPFSSEWFRKIYSHRGKGRESFFRACTRYVYFLLHFFILLLSHFRTERAKTSTRREWRKNLSIRSSLMHFCFALHFLTLKCVHVQCAIEIKN